MPTIRIETNIQAPIERVFDLSRSIDLHKISTEHTKEEAIAGVTSGLIGANESVTWRAKHFGVYQTLSSRITAFDRPHFFLDEQAKGIFKRFKHEHRFHVMEEGTQMLDIFDYESPLGILGKIADWLFLERYMTKLLMTRNATIKEFAETDNWQLVLEQKRSTSL
ncbi:MAG: SRPBCC family protein [Bacteroidota bacterium]